LVANVQEFEQGLADVPGFMPFTTSSKASRVYWRFPIRIEPDGADLDAIVHYLQSRGFPVERSRAKPLYKNTVIRDYYGITSDRDYPVAEKINDEILRVDAFALFEQGAAQRLLEACADFAKQ
jgi:dTDP-4-amino-4,6-dideoxygalactose transaminase